MKSGDIKSIKRGQVFLADLSLGKGSEQGGVRPVLVIQNDIGNRYSPTTVVLSITGQIDKCKLPTHVLLSKEHGFARNSVILCEQVRTIDKSRLQKFLCELDELTMKKVENSILISLGLAG